MKEKGYANTNTHHYLPNTIPSETSAYFETDSSAPLLDCFHCIFYLKDATLWTPSHHIRIILHRERSDVSKAYFTPDNKMISAECKTAEEMS